ncbi:hypothetical protein SSP24_39060 [Streptomyces spinoverrucosus]|uniref:Uncharacterized protein n=1 Tax=Streptomyces spinoverrucosus TaxID=284043 RepID=A0A4Y3VKJ6_9ACTN|nr:hypothetical protein [Streptomyces spinoverrucosus]GEC06251.1 hypothetical protein SSP24_39060 [Streptomyces spinoverrucosus]GHB75688.1 hypothetical protein GCM10010397_52630 [Streptomyces spinoverrucosus]
MPKDPAPATSLAKKDERDEYQDRPDDTQAYDDHDDHDEWDEDPEEDPVRETVAEDDRFGTITVHLDTELGEVVVEGERVPRIELYREDGTEGDDHTPIGTRDGSLLTLTVDGEEAEIVPAKGRLTRRSFAVDVRHAGSTWRLVPDSIPGSRLLRGEEHIGDFTSDGDGHVLAEWREGVEYEALDAALGYALAAAFGTGAQPMWMLAIEAAGDMIPG